MIRGAIAEEQKPAKQKPRTYRRQARKAFLGLVKQRRPKRQTTQRAIKHQLIVIHGNPDIAHNFLFNLIANAN